MSQKSVALQCKSQIPSNTQLRLLLSSYPPSYGLCLSLFASPTTPIFPSGMPLPVNYRAPQPHTLTIRARYLFKNHGIYLCKLVHKNEWSAHAQKFQESLLLFVDWAALKCLQPNHSVVLSVFSKLPYF